MANDVADIDRGVPWAPRFCAVLLAVVWLAGLSAARAGERCGKRELEASCPMSASALDCDRTPCQRRLREGRIELVRPGTGYSLECLCPGDGYYNDRYWTPSHTLACVPPELAGAVWIRTANGFDKHEESPDFLAFRLTTPATVYVGYDSRIVESGAPPDWLRNDFHDTGRCIDIQEPDPQQEFVLFRRKVESGLVRLGGNRAQGARFHGTEGSNYVVAVVFSEDAPRDGDADGVPDREDNCPDVANTSQSDCDDDDRGNACDADYNNDGSVDMADVEFFVTALSRVRAGGSLDACVDADANGKLETADLQLLVDQLSSGL